MNSINNSLVSIIINCHNSEKFLKETMESVIDQDFSNWEMIIWDNKSSDKTIQIAKSFKDERIKIFQSNIFTKLGNARNLALSKANGEFVCFLDSDDIWMPSKLSKQIAKFQDEKIGIVICNSVFFKSNKNIKKLYKRPPTTGYVFRRLLSKYDISLETVMIRKKALDKFKICFDPNLEVTEEYDLFLRISYYWKLDYVNETLAKWRIHDDNSTWRNEELFPIEREIVLKNLEILDNDFNIKYEKEVNNIRRTIDFEKSLIFLKNKQAKKSRSIIKKYISKNVKFRIYYLLTFLPYFIFYKIYNLRKKYI